MRQQFVFKKYAPQYSAEPSEAPVCNRYARCEGCPYPRHGFICWHSDGDCLRTDMERIAAKQKNQKGKSDDTTRI